MDYDTLDKYQYKQEILLKIVHPNFKIQFLT